MMNVGANGVKNGGKSIVFLKNFLKEKPARLASEPV